MQIKLMTLGMSFIFLSACLGNKPDMEQGKLRFLALGDSYTIGESVLAKERWPVVLTEKLEAEKIFFQSPEIIAVTGWTSDELLDGIKKAQPKGSYDLVSLLIGVNNQYRGGSEKIYAKEFKLLLQKAIAFAGGDSKKVFVLSIPDWGVMPFAEGRDQYKISLEIDSFNQINRKITSELKVAYVDITPISREARKNKSLGAKDGLHPSGKMYRLWVDLMFPTVSNILNPSSVE